MSFNYKWAGNNFHVIFENATSYNEIVEAGNIIFGDKRFELIAYVIFDFLNVEKLELTNHEIKMISVLDRSASRWNQNLKLAIVLNKEYIRELVAYYKHLMLGVNWEIESFDNTDDANKWCKQFET